MVVNKAKGFSNGLDIAKDLINCESYSDPTRGLDLRRTMLARS